MEATPARAKTSARSIVRLAVLAFALIAFVLWGRSVALRTDADLPTFRLANGQTSPEALVERLVEAFAANDRNAVESLRINQNEYLALILPGSVRPGQPPQIMPPDKAAYFWRHSDTLSRYRLDNLMKGLGGRKYNVERIEVLRVDKFAWYTAHRDPTIYLETDDGQTASIQLGTIAEHNGRFKFISYFSD